MAEQLANLARTTLNGAIDNDDTSVVVTDGSVFPSSGIFRVNIEDELLKVAARSGNTLTVVRGAEGTVAASHGNGVAVTAVVTRDALLRLGSRTVLTGAHGSRPAAAEDNEGALYLPNDAPSIARSNGIAWEMFGPICPLTPPVNGDFAWVNQNSATVTAEKDYIFLKDVGRTTPSIQFAIRKKAAPSTPYSVTACLLVTQFVSQSWRAGLCWRESSTGALVVITQSGNTIAVAKYASPTSFSANYFSKTLTQIPRWWRIRDDGTNRICSWSADGINFIPFHTVSRTDFMTADEVGICVDGIGTSPAADVGLTLLSWKETS